jgi:hypothetical protein
MANSDIRGGSCPRNIRPCFERDGVGVVPLTRGLESIVDLADLPVVATHNWQALCTKGGHAYGMRSRVVNGERFIVMMHRLILGAPHGMVVDHINGNGLDNRRCNIRICSQSDNMKNQVIHRINRLGIQGVSRAKGRYKATITHDGVRAYLGSYTSADLAAAAREGAERALGRIARG